MTRRDWIERTVEAHEHALVAYAARILHGDLERARDVVQDCFLRLWEADRAAVEGHEARWLYTVCRRRAIDVGRKETRMRPSEDGVLEAAGRPPIPGGDPRGARPESGPDAEEARDGLLALVGALPPRQQEALRLRFHGGLAYADIAEVMGTTANAVGVLLHQAIHTLRGRAAGSAALGGSEVTR